MTDLASTCLVRTQKTLLSRHEEYTTISRVMAYVACAAMSLQVDSVYRRRKHPSNVLTAMAMTVPSVRISSTHIRHARNNGYVPTASARTAHIQHTHTYSAPLKKRQNEDKKAAREAQFNSERPAWLQRKSKEPAEKPTSA